MFAFSDASLMFVCSLLQSKALRERWLLDGAPAEEETQKRLQEDEVKTKLLEQVILRSATQSPDHRAPSL